MAGSARVLRVSGPTAMIELDGRELEARVQPRLSGRPLVVGDRVGVRTSDADVTIVEIEARRSVLERAAGLDGPRRVVVANADMLCVVESLTRPEPRPHLIDRYLVAAHVGGLEPVVLLTKYDLLDDPTAGNALADLYREVGYDVIVGSAKDPQMVRRVADRISARVAAFAGQSGVGKSTLTRGLTGVDRAVGAVSDRAGTGRHTTSDPRLFRLPSGGGVVDTAGVRTFFLPSLDPEDAADAFPEIRAIAGRCRFRDCRHLGDTGCVLPGLIAPTRYESYRILLENP